MNKSWTAKMEKIVRDGRKKGHSASIIAAHVTKAAGYHVSRNAVLGLCRRLGLSKKDDKRRALNERKASEKLEAVMPRVYYSDNSLQFRYFYGEGTEKTQCKLDVERGAYCLPHWVICHHE